ncbi:hypothetical protein J8L08_14260 [Bacteroides fragilis]|jgi:hypothetical protein|uniref:hypothetical protein n=1 Tax=Bacteroides fragilis TaxID=817 RepID=UPI0020300209|nr:hypothetical protein [Bacteroides fragilis]MCM0276794.1 hypothetical protein [Bacteroides fragilis]DAM68236.1 MAG TPA: hypothetical protein [Caudoviricetes sp.]
MKIEVYIRKKSIIREVLHELPQYKRALEELFCAANGWEACSGYISNIEDPGYQELYISILNRIKELRANFPDDTKDSSNTGE